MTQPSTMNLNHQINLDHESLIHELEPDELEIAKTCAYKVKAHLEKLSLKDQQYLNNLSIVNNIISQYDKALRCGINSSRLN